jgi:hypothetical protein
MQKSHKLLAALHLRECHSATFGMTMALSASDIPPVRIAAVFLVRGFAEIH